jgi:hypothetical protein
MDDNNMRAELKLRDIKASVDWTDTAEITIETDSDKFSLHHEDALVLGKFLLNYVEFYR